jgi:hypothetical protein
LTYANRSSEPVSIRQFLLLTASDCTKCTIIKIFDEIDNLRLYTVVCENRDKATVPDTVESLFKVYKDVV